MKKILGLDLGTNSIGWAVIQCDEISENEKNTLRPTAIESAGSRIIPMDAATLGDFNKGNTVSQTKERTAFRGVRRLRERELLRRARLHRTLEIMEFLPKHYIDSLDRYGNILEGHEPKLPWSNNEDGKRSFIFKSSFEEMLNDFQSRHPESNTLIPYDWTIYYLRKKALTSAVTKEELAWILLNFNQKRGYYQLRGEDDEPVDNSKTVEYKALKVISVEKAEDRKSTKGNWYAITLENGDTYYRTSSSPLEWAGLTKDFIITTDIDKKGNPIYDKEGQIKRKYRAPNDDDWTLLKKKTEHDIDTSDKTVGEFIYESLINKPEFKIKGKLVRTIERKYYKNELRLILQKQKEYIPELNDKDLFKKCIEELYPNNDAHRNILSSQDFTYLFIEDIIFYQRPLKSKKSLISECPFEYHSYKDTENNTQNKSYIKCIAKSHPLFQEFRIWQFISNLKLFEKERKENGIIHNDFDVTSEFLKDENAYADLFEWMNCHDKIDQKSLMGYFNIKKLKGSDTGFPYRWNYVEDKTYPGNETHAQILSFLKKAKENTDFLNNESEEALWHILYSISDKKELEKALHAYAIRYNLSSSFEEAFRKFPPFKNEYGGYSAKAIKKLLPLMRRGRYWEENAWIIATAKENLNKIKSGDIPVKDKARETICNVTEFKGLPLWIASYLIYGKHSEAKETTKWESPEDINNFLKDFKQYSLRNPIVEQVILECLRVVRDIWQQAGQIDEIHIELGREMKNPADKRRQETERLVNNENRNLRIKALLTEFMDPSYQIDNINPYSPSQQEIFKIYEDYALCSKEQYDSQKDSFTSDDGVPEDILSILKKFDNKDKKDLPTKNDINRYRLWLEQRYRSPYTGKMIPLSRLFTTDYQIEHVIPQSIYFDNSLNNKVICESAVNKLKDNSLGMAFIKNHRGEKVEIGFGKYVEILSPDQYIDLVRKNYSSNRTKMEILLSEDIPEKFISRQMNDSRYISKYVMGLLSNIVREKDENGEYEKEAISKNIVPIVGQITDLLKKEWGLNDAWNRIMLPRYKRMNEITGSSEFTTTNTQGHTIPNMPDRHRRGFNPKRIDHRHHAMDAIVIACTTKDHVNLLNNSLCNGEGKKQRFDLQKKLRNFEQIIIDGKTRSVAKNYLKPWQNFTTDAENVISNIIVSFKKNTRIITRSTNYYTRIVDGNKTKERQTTSDNWAIRKPLHKDTVFAQVNLKKVKTVSLAVAIQNPSNIVDKEFRKFIIDLVEKGHNLKNIKKILSIEENKQIWSDVNISKINYYYYSKNSGIDFYATRKPLDTSFKKEKITASVTDTGAQKILLAHLDAKNNDPTIAFSPEGIEEMNRNIQSLNSGHSHKPIYKVRVYEQANKFPIGNTGNKGKKYVEAAKGTNLYAAIYQTEKIDEATDEITFGRRYETIPMRTIVERLKQGNTPVPEVDSNGNRLLFYLSPGDLVYLPKSATDTDIQQYNIDRSRIYKMVSCSDYTIYFIPFNVASILVDKIEYSSHNKSERSIEGLMIKETCIPIEIDRLGNIL